MLFPLYMDTLLPALQPQLCLSSSPRQSHSSCSTELKGTFSGRTWWLSRLGLLHSPGACALPSFTLSTFIIISLAIVFVAWNENSRKTGNIPLLFPFIAWDLNTESVIQVGCHVRWVSPHQPKLRHGFARDFWSVVSRPVQRFSVEKYEREDGGGMEVFWCWI